MVSKRECEEALPPSSSAAGSGLYDSTLLFGSTTTTLIEDVRLCRTLPLFPSRNRTRYEMRLAWRMRRSTSGGRIKTARFRLIIAPRSKWRGCQRACAIAGSEPAYRNKMGALGI